MMMKFKPKKYFITSKNLYFQYNNYADITVDNKGIIVITRGFANSLQEDNITCETAMFSSSIHVLVKIKKKSICYEELRKAYFDKNAFLKNVKNKFENSLTDSNIINYCMEEVNRSMLIINNDVVKKRGV